MRSPSSRRAWVEIWDQQERPDKMLVALLAEGVGRNCIREMPKLSTSPVALLAEGVGRNDQLMQVCEACGIVALLAEGVGRNLAKMPGFRTAQESPSSRRAWVEIEMDDKSADMDDVALLAEGVGRNSWHG